MIIIRFHGGLGNQMFQYVFYEYMKRKYNVPIKADLTWFERNYKEHQGYELQRVFGIQLEEASYKEIAEIHEHYPKYYPFAALRYLARKNAIRKNRKIGEKNKEKHIYDFGPLQYQKNNIYDALDINKDWYIEGIFCSDCYWNEFESEIKEKLIFEPELDEENQKLVVQMNNTNSVAIHVRRGDYVGNVFDIVGPEYYKQAVSIIKEKVQNPVFYVFSDDMEYIQKEFVFLENYVPVHNSAKSSYIDMQLISNCKNAIIANSSFSYWGAMLGETNHCEDKGIIIAPKKYKSDEDVVLARKHWMLV